MTILTVLAFLGVVAAWWAIRRGVAGAKPLLAVAVAAALVAVGLGQWRQVRQSPERQKVHEEAEAGRVLGAMLAEARPTGPILVLRLPPLNRGRYDLSRHRFAGVQEALKGLPNPIVEGGPDLGVPHDGPPSFVVFQRETLADEVTKWCAAHPDTVAIVSLLPVTPDFGRGLPPVYGFYSGREAAWHVGLKSGTVRGAMLYRNGPAPAEASDLPAKFLLATPANADEALTEQGGKR